MFHRWQSRVQNLNLLRRRQLVDVILRKAVIARQPSSRIAILPAFDGVSSVNEVSYLCQPELAGVHPIIKSVSNFCHNHQFLSRSRAHFSRPPRRLLVFNCAPSGAKTTIPNCVTPSDWIVSNPIPFRVKQGLHSWGIARAYGSRIRRFLPNSRASIDQTPGPSIASAAAIVASRI
jgi:hypothetical protein